MTGQLESRPWGWFEVIAEGEGWKVKILTVKPGHMTSLQRHEKRSELWIVLSGTAATEVFGRRITRTEREMVWIPPHEVHRLSNVSDTDELIVLELQRGDYLGEDDIERLEDRYERA